MIGQTQRLHELNRLSGKKDVLSFGSPLVAFTSGKGGTGKSCLILNIAIAAAAMGKKVLLVDLDVNLANLHIMLNVTPRESLNHFFNDKVLFSEIVYKIDENLSCIFGGSEESTKRLNNSNLESFFKKLTTISADYDLVLIDTAPGTGETTEKILSTCTHNVIVTNPEPTSVMDSYIVLKLLKSIGYKNEKLVLVNKASRIEFGQEAFQNLNQAASHFLKEEINLLGIVGFSQEITESVMKQNPFMYNRSEDEIYTQIKQVTVSLLKIIQLANIAQ